MNNRKRIKEAVRDNNFKIVSIDYIRQHVAVPEETVPVGWYLVAQVSDVDGDVMEFYGDVDDIISQINCVNDYFI